MSWLEEAEEAAPWDLGSDEPAAATASAEDGTPAAAAPKAAAAADGDGGPSKFANREKAPKPHYTYHWVKPLFLNYAYIYDYRQNYYDDVIDWMNKRNKGIYRETPRAQEWAERASRSADKRNLNKSVKRTSDIGILLKCKPTIHYYSYHTRAYYSLKYQKIL